MQIPNCPNCHGPLAPKMVVCRPCGLEITGPFEANEFSKLDSETLHFLRIFVHCEGRIRDMEKALGVSYPTIKGKLQRLKTVLGLGDVSASEGLQEDSANNVAADDAAETSKESDVSDVMSSLEKGEVSVNEALRQIRRKRKKS